MSKFTIKKKGSLDIGKRLEELKKLAKYGLPKIIGNEVVNFSKDTFRQGGFTDAAFNPWKPRKDQSKKNQGRAILVKSGDLRRSIKKQVSVRKVTISSNLPYAAVHNYGLKAGRNGFTMPQRKFLGPSKTLSSKIKNTIKKEIDRVFE